MTKNSPQPRLLRWLLNINSAGAALTIVCCGLFFVCVCKPNMPIGSAILPVGIVIAGLSLLAVLVAGISCVIYRRSPVEPLVTLGIVSLAISIVLPALSHLKLYYARPACPWHLSQIGTGLWLYARDHNGMTPATLEELAAAVDLSSDALVCPNTEDRPPDRKQPLAQQRVRPGHRSYRYLIPNQRLADFSDDTPILVEDPANHENEGANVLFGDGHVEWIMLREAREMFAATRPTSRPARR